MPDLGNESLPELNGDVPASEGVNYRVDHDSLLNDNPGDLINDRDEEEEKSASGQRTPTAEIETRIN